MSRLAPHHRRGSIHGLATLLFLLAAALPLSAQWYGVDEQTEYFVSKTQVAGSRLAEQNIERAGKDLAGGEYERCVRLIQETIDDHGSKALSTDSGRFMGIREFCNDFIRGLPPEGLAAYRAVFDPYAEVLYLRGIADQNPEVLKEVYVRYLETSWGKKALLAAISIELEQGELHEAVWLSLLHREIYGDDEDGANVLAAMITAASLLGDRERLSGLEATVTPETLGRMVEIAGYPTPLGEFLKAEIADLDQHAGDASMRPSPKADLFKEERWLETYDMRPGSSDTSARLEDFGEDAPVGEIPWNPVMPVVDSSSVYVTNGVSVSCYEVFSHALRWSFQGWADRAQARPNRSITLPLTVAGNVVYTSLETPLDAERKIWTFTPQLQIPHRQMVALDAATGRVIWQHNRFRGRSAEETDFIAELNINSRPLVFGDKLFVAASRFHTSYHQYVCCFDRRDGHLLWSTFVCTGQMEQNMFGNRVREAISGDLVEKDGVLYHSTNIGVVAAIDARLGSLRFTVEYPQIQIPRQTRFDARVHERAPAWANDAPIIVGNRVYFAPMDCQKVIAVDLDTGKPVETGLERNKTNRYRYLVGPWKDWIVACGARVAFHNTRTGETIEPSYGFSATRRDSTIYEAGVIGRPLVMNGRLIASVNSRGTAKLMIWSIEDQRIIDEQALPSGRNTVSLGNLAESDGVAVIAATTSGGGQTQIRAYFDREKVRRALQDAVTRSPEDPAARFRLGEFALQGEQKDPAAALANFEAALARANAAGMAGEAWGARARDALLRLYLDIATTPRLASEKLGIDADTAFERAFAVADEPLKKVEILFLLMRRAYDTRNAEAFDRQLERVSGEFASTPYDYPDLFRDQLPALKRGRYNGAMVAYLVASSFEERRGRPELAIARYQTLISRWPREVIGGKTAWQYAFDGIERLVARHGREVYAAEEKAAQDLFDRGSEGGGFRLLQRVLDEYPNSSVVTRAYRAISRAQLGAGDVDGAIRGIHEFLSRFGQVTGEPLALLAEALEQRDMKESAAQIWRRLASLGAHEADDPEFIERARARLAAQPQTRRDPTEAPHFGLAPKIGWTEGNADAPGEWSLIEPRGRRPAAAENIVLTQRSRVLAALSLDDGRTLWSMDALDGIETRTSAWWDGRLIVLIDQALVVIDPATGREIWRYQPDALDISAFVVGQGKVFLLLEKSGFPTDFNIQTRSLVDGSFVAEKVVSGVARSEGLTIGERFLMVPLENRLAALVLDGLTLEAAPAWPDGFELSDVLEPFFAADDHVIAVTQAGTRADQEIIAADPTSGRVKWRRKVGEGPARFYLDQAPDLLIYRLRPGASPETVIAVDTLMGTALFKQSLPKGVDLADVPIVSGNDVIAVQKGFENRVSIYAECYGMATNSTRWRSTNFTGRTLVRAHPFAEGVVLRVIEDMRGVRDGRWKTMLYLIDRASGRVENEIELETRSSSSAGEIAFIGGRLVVADGPLLKVYLP